MAAALQCERLAFLMRQAVHAATLGRLGEPCAWTTTAAGRDHDPATRQRVFADLGQLPESRRSRSSRGLTRSIGSGRISVEERSELISSIVWR